MILKFKPTIIFGGIRMAEKMKVYKCALCGNIIEVLHAGMGTLVCCGQPMKIMAEKSEDTGMEKHLPVIVKGEDCLKVKVGSVSHPMEGNHYIEWIEVVEKCGSVHRKHLKPGDDPEAGFHVCCDVKEIRSYCNVHGHWKAEGDVGSSDTCCCQSK